MSPEVADLLIEFARSGEERFGDIGEALRAAPITERDAFLRRVADRADEASGDEKAFLEGLPDALGLVDDGD